MNLEPSRRTSRLLCLLTAFALLLLTAVIYWPGLNGPLILDDVPNLDIMRVLDVQGRLSLTNVLAERGGVLGGRPVSWATFVLNWQLAGDDVWSYKVANLVLHLVNGCLVLLLARTLLAAGGRSASIWQSYMVCALWLLMPLQVTTVLYVVQRMTLLCAFFVFLGLFTYLQGRLSLQAGQRKGTALIAVSLLLCWPLATLSKQNGVLLVPLLLVCEYLFFFKPDVPRWPRQLVLASCILMALAGLARVFLEPSWMFGTYEIREFTVEQRLLTQPRVLLDYALNALQLPGGVALGLFHDDFQISTSILSPPTTLAALMACIFIPLLAWRLRRTPLASVLFGLLFFLVAHALEAGPFALEMYFEHRNYLPTFGLCFSLVAGAALIGERWSRPAVVSAMLMLVGLGYAILTTTRVWVWTSWEGIVQANVAAHPTSPRARAGAAIVAFTSGDLPTGIVHLQVVRETEGARAELPVVLKTLVGHCLTEKAPPQSLRRRLRALTHLEADPYSMAALRWYRTVVTTRDCPGLDHGAVAVELDRLAKHRRDGRDYGQDWVLHDELARLLAHAGHMVKASEQLASALIIAPASRREEIRSRMQSLVGK